MSDTTSAPAPYDPAKIREIANRIRDPAAVAKDVPGAISTLAFLLVETCEYIESAKAEIVALAGGMIGEAAQKADKALAGVLLLKKQLDGEPVPAKKPDAAPAANQPAPAAPIEQAPSAEGAEIPPEILEQLQALDGSEELSGADAEAAAAYVMDGLVTEEKPVDPAAAAAALNPKNQGGGRRRK